MDKKEIYNLLSQIIDENSIYIDEPMNNVHPSGLVVLLIF